MPRKKGAPLEKSVVLLRGVNVGGHNKVPMAALREACEADFSFVETYLQSGNLVLTAKGDTASRIEKVIKKTFGHEIAAIVRKKEEWAAYVDANPFPDETASEPNRVMLLVSKEPAKEDAVETLTAKAANGERIVAVADGLAIHYRDGQARTKLSPSLVDRLVGSPTTARNWNTVLALKEMLDR